MILSFLLLNAWLIVDLLLFCFSSTRDFYERGVKKMLSSFPLKEEILRLKPAADPRKRDSFTAAQILQLAARVKLVSQLLTFRMSW